MKYGRYIIEIDNTEVEGDFYKDLSVLEVELDDNLANMFRMTLVLTRELDGAWTYLDDTSLMVWKKVAIAIGFEDSTEDVISGYITHVKPHFTPDETQCTLEIWGMDGSILMDREEKIVAWPKMKDSDIAKQVIGLYSLTASVENTEVVHDEAISTIIQRETDMQFLKRLARRNGFDCYVDGTTVYFGPAPLDESPQPVLAAHFGEETTLSSFSVDVNGLASPQVGMFQVDRLNKEVLTVTADTSQQTLLGKKALKSLLGTGMKPGQLYVNMNTMTSDIEMTKFCQGQLHQAEWFVTGEGEIDGNAYEHVLRPRATVTIKGVGETYSGVYYVSHVTHTFQGPEVYRQHFRVKRNAILPSGSEDFSAASSGLF